MITALAVLAADSADTTWPDVAMVAVIFLGIIGVAWVMFR